MYIMKGEGQDDSGPKQYLPQSQDEWKVEVETYAHTSTRADPEQQCLSTDT